MLRTDIASDDAERKPAQAGDRMVTVMRMRGLTAQERLVLAAITYHDGRGGAFPTIAKIGDLAGGIGARAVRYHTAALAQKGVIAKRRGQRGSRYSIDYEWSAVKFLTGNMLAALKRRTREFQTGNTVAALDAQTGNTVAAKPLPQEQSYKAPAVGAPTPSADAGAKSDFPTCEHDAARGVRRQAGTAWQDDACEGLDTEYQDTPNERAVAALMATGHARDRGDAWAMLSEMSPAEIETLTERN